MLRIKITPKFDTKEIIDSTIGKFWFEFQAESFEIGASLAQYIQSYINSNRKRQGNTGKLAGTMLFEPQSGAGFISWGIGRIALLNSVAPYWYVINYGKKITGAPFVPPSTVGYFGQGSKPDSSKAGTGTERWHPAGGKGAGFFMRPARVVRAINYIQVGEFELNRRISQLIIKLKRSF